MGEWIGGDADEREYLTGCRSLINMLILKALTRSEVVALPVFGQASVIKSRRGNEVDTSRRPA